MKTQHNSMRTEQGFESGAGGMGEVYRARDEKLNRNVATKVLPSRYHRIKIDCDDLSRERRPQAR